MNGENNFGNNNGNQFNGFNNNPNDMNNNNFNQGIQPNQGFNNVNNFNQGMQSNPGVNQNMNVNSGYNPVFGNVANNGMNPNMNQIPVGGYGANNTSNNNRKNTIIGIGVFVGIVAVVLVLIVVGFKIIGGGKTLTCELSQSSYGLEMKMVDEIKYKKKGKSIEKVTITLSKDDGFTDDEYETIKNSFEDTFEDVDDDDFVVKPKITKKGEKVEITGTTKEDYEDKTFDELKKEMEEDGYTCK